MNEANQQRLVLAKKMAIAYLTDPKLKAIGIAGSVARGQADA